MKSKSTKRKPKTLTKRALNRKAKSWLEAWRTEERAKLMEARYDLGVEISGLIDDHEGQHWEEIAESVGAVSEELEAATQILSARQTIYQENQSRVRKKEK